MTVRNQRSNRRTSGNPRAATNGRTTPKGTRPAGVHAGTHHGDADRTDAPRTIESHGDRGHGRTLPIQPSVQRTGHRGNR